MQWAAHSPLRLLCSAARLQARQLLPQAALHRHPLLKSPWKRTTAIMAYYDQLMAMLNKRR